MLGHQANPRGGAMMSFPAQVRRRHGIANALGKACLVLQRLAQQQPCSAREQRLVAIALEGLAELEAIVRDEVDARLIDQPLPLNNVPRVSWPPPPANPGTSASGRVGRG